MQTRTAGAVIDVVLAEVSIETRFTSALKCSTCYVRFADAAILARLVSAKVRKGGRAVLTCEPC